MEGDAKLASYSETHAANQAGQVEGHSSGVSWGAVVGGAFATAAFSLILLALGAGMGFSSISPWTSAGVSASTFGTTAIVWLIVVEIVASALGGYLTGRLRIKWAVVHSDEVFFRDTANGFLAWAVAVVMTVTFLASAAFSLVGSTSQPSDTGQRSSTLDPNAYFVDTLFRTETPETEKTSPVPTEAGRLFAHAIKESEMSGPDRTYLAGLISSHTGINQSDAEKRISDVVTNARRAEDEARRITARMLLWSFLALLMGAFSSSFAATIGGRQRDHLKLV